MGFVLTIGLGALAFVGGSALAERWYGDASRSERALVSFLLALSLGLVPIHVLGWTNLLSPASIGIGVTSVSLLAFGLAATAGRARDALSSALTTALLPFEALHAAWRARSASLFALGLLYGVFLYTAWLAWLAPSSSWDGLMYHEGMVAYALRNGGYAWVSMPPEIELINGFPRGAEALQLYFVAFADRRLIDFAQHVTALPAVLVIYVLARRFAPSLVASGLAAAAFLVPGFVLQLRSTYIDVTVTAVLLSAVHFATRPELRVRDLWMLALTAGLYGGMKANAPVVVPFLLLVALLRSVPLLRRGQVARTLVTYVLGLAVVVALAAPTYVRNWIEKDNPAWPVDVTIPVIDVTFDGVWNVQDQHHSFDQTVKDLYGAPKPGEDFVDTRHRGYGHAVPFVILPVALLALLAAIGHAIAAVFARKRAPPGTFGILMLTVVIAIAQLPSPAFWWARFNLHGLALLFVLAAWALRLDRRRFWAEATIGASTAIAAMTLWWADPAWDVSFEEALELAELPPRERAVRRIGWAVMMEDVGRAREAEIREDDVVGWNGGFIGVAWNEDLSNDVVHVPWGPGYLERLDAAGAEWAITRKRTPSERALEASPRYERIGDVGPNVVAYRRTSM